MSSKIIYSILYIINILNICYSFYYPSTLPKMKSMPIYAIKNARANYMSDNTDDTSSYLDRLNKKNDTNINKLEKVKNNITKYIQSKKDTHTIEKGFTATFYPIPKASFDTIFLNIYHITKVYISSNVDRMVFELTNGKRYVYYIKDNDEKNKMEKLINLIPNKVKFIIINDVYKVMDDPFGYLYCESN